jgi:hypothetical protein
LIENFSEFLNSKYQLNHLYKSFSLTNASSLGLFGCDSRGAELEVLIEEGIFCGVNLIGAHTEGFGCDEGCLFNLSGS